MKLMRCIFLVLNKCIKYCQKEKKQQNKNKIGAMHFFKYNLLNYC